MSTTTKKSQIIPRIEKGDTPVIILPEGLDWRDAANFCSAKADEMEAVTNFPRHYHTLPYSGAYAVQRLLDRKYSAVAVEAKEVSVPSGNGTKTIRWGTWQIAGLGRLRMDTLRVDGGVEFSVTIKALRKERARVDELLDEIGKEIAKRELYAGSAIILKPDENGELDMVAPPDITVVEQCSPADLVLEAGLDAAVRAEVFGPIVNTAKLKQLGVPCRRGILASGRPGTGKTMTCRVAASLAIEREWTVFYLGDARAIEAAIKIAHCYAPALLVCEDIDRSMSGKRDALVDRVLNALDGLDRSAEVVLIATSNDDTALPAPLLRPGRLDSCLTFGVPDKHAAMVLVRRYLRDNADAIALPYEGSEASDTMIELAETVTGLLPASLREVASRSLLHAVSQDRTKPTSADVLASAITVRRQQDRLEEAEKPRDETPTLRVMHTRDEVADRTRDGGTPGQRKLSPAKGGGGAKEGAAGSLAGIGALLS